MRLSPALLLVPLLSAPLPATAQVAGPVTPPAATPAPGDPPPPAPVAPLEKRPGAILTLQVENDVLSRWATDTDRDYTSGLRLGWLSPPTEDLPDWLVRATTLPTFMQEPAATSVVRRWGLSLGHNLYTPENTATRALVTDDRPYAAWAYVGASLQYAYTINGVPRWLDSIQLDIGVIGPAAQGETIQNDWHGLIGVDKTFGWGNQLRNEPTINLAVERRWRTAIVDIIPEWGLEADIVPYAGVAVGNVVTFANVGGILRFGNDVGDDFGPPRSRPSLPGSETFTSKDGFGWYLFGGLGLQAYVRNVFLDGNTFQNSHNVEKKPFVIEGQVGLALIFPSFRVTYTHVVRSPEFEERERLHQYGSVSIAVPY